jgi:hypothetical protein
MDADRRHELQANGLATWLQTKGPNFLRQHGNKILLGIAAVSLLVLALQWRARAQEQNRQLINASLSSAWDGVEQARSLALRPLPPEQLAELRNTAESTTNAAIDAVLGDTDADPAVLSSALLARGQLYWELADLAEPPAATTRPALRAALGRDEMLKRSADAYERVIKNFPNVYDAKVNAQFSLAAIDESLNQLDGARKRYEALAADASLRPAHRKLATQHLKQLDELAQPLFLAAPATQPTTQPLAIEPATRPTTAPVVAVTPATQPTTSPAR